MRASSLLVKSVFLGVALVASASSASATSYLYNPNPTPEHNPNAGSIEYFSVTYDDVSQSLDLKVVLEAHEGKLAEGFTLAISDGPNPKGNDHLALLYFDATNDTPILTAYVYNGENNQTSYLTGPTLLNANDAPNGTNAVGYELAGTSATFSFSLDASAINDNPAANGLANWLGIAFDDSIGVWFHPFASLSTEYNNEGALTYWQGQQGWLDIADHKSTEVPEPTTMALLGAAVLGGVYRRRKGEGGVA